MAKKEAKMTTLKEERQESTAIKVHGLHGSSSTSEPFDETNKWDESTEALRLESKESLFW